MRVISLRTKETERKPRDPRQKALALLADKVSWPKGPDELNTHNDLSVEPNTQNVINQPVLFYWGDEQATRAPQTSHA